MEKLRDGGRHMKVYLSVLGSQLSKRKPQRYGSSKDLEPPSGLELAFFGGQNKITQTFYSESHSSMYAHMSK
jgi:hypothetical protein